MPVMQYIMIIREEVACLVILLYIGLTFLIAKRKKNFAHRLFALMLSVSIVNVILDAVTIYTVNNMDIVPMRLNHFLHILYVGSFPVFLWTAFLYTRNLAFPEEKHKWNIFEVLPVFAALILVAVLPMEFIETPYSNYSSGPADLVAYIFAFIYFLLCVYYLVRYGKRMEPKARRGVVISMFSLLVVVVTQGIFNQILMTALGVTLINVALFYTVESPDAILIENLADARRRADEANDAKSQFLARMSHEIRTPINAVLGMDEMILRESTEENVLEYADNIKHSGRTLLSLVNDILDISKVEAGKMEIVPAQYELGTLLSDIYNMSFERAKQKDLEFKLEADRTLPQLLYGDEIRIKQCVMNLLSNAIKYTENGEVILSVNCASLEGDKIGLQFKVKDTGIGIKEEDLERLFDAFARFDEQKNRAVEGTGLGMGITRQLLVLMGSDLKIESEYGVGSTFSFIVMQKIVSAEPMGDFMQHYEKNEKEQRAKEREIFMAPDASALVVDDTPMNLKVIRLLMRETKINLDTAVSGKEAVEKAAEKDYDIIFIDHMMPGMDGFETLKEIRRLPKNKDTVCVALTANAISGARDIYVDAGFDDYLSKPVESENLTALLKRHLGEK